MTCQEFISRLGDYFDGGMAARKRKEGDKHASECPDCAAYLASYQATIRAARRAYDDAGQRSTAQFLALINQIRSRMKATFQGADQHQDA